MRVLHVTRDLAPRINGGISVAVRGLVDASRAAGLRCAVVSFDGWRSSGRPGPAQLDVPGEARVARVRTQGDLERAGDLAHRFAPDLVHVHHALLWRQLPSAAPRVFSVHVAQARQSSIRGVEGPTLSERAQAEALDRAAAVFAPSRDVVDDLRAWAAARDRALAPRLAPLGLALSSTSEPFNPSAPLPPDERRSRHALFVGRLSDIKGVDVLARAIDLVSAREPRARFTLAGGLPDSSRSERRARARLSRSLGERGREVTRVLGWCSPEELARERAAAGLLVAPSRYETFGLAVLEARAAGMAVVASRVGGLAEQLTDGVDGRLVRPGHAGELAEAVLELMADPAGAAALGARAAERARGEAWSERVQAYLEGYEAVLAGRR